MTDTFCEDMLTDLYSAKRLYVEDNTWPRLRGIPLDEQLGPVEGFSSSAPRRPGVSYLVISGHAYKKNGKFVVSARYRFEAFGKENKPYTFVEPLKDLPMNRSSAHMIVRVGMVALNSKIAPQPDRRHLAKKQRKLARITMSMTLTGRRTGLNDAFDGIRYAVQRRSSTPTCIFRVPFLSFWRASGACFFNDLAV